MTVLSPTGWERLERMGGQVDYVLLDIGGVLVDDVWERMLLDPEAGLAARHGVDRAAVEAVGREVWGTVSRRAATEQQWWSGIESGLDREIAEGERQELRALVRADARARAALERVCEAGSRLGVVSDNTSFWWAWQLDLASVSDLVEPPLRFLSCERGTGKSDVPGLLELALSSVPPEATVLVDDRVRNLERAAALGAATLHMAFGTGTAHAE